MNDTLRTFQTSIFHFRDFLMQYAASLFSSVTQNYVTAVP